jgi:hypothetical protein
MADQDQKKYNHLLRLKGAIDAYYEKCNLNEIVENDRSYSRLVENMNDVLEILERHCKFAERSRGGSRKVKTYKKSRRYR